MQLTGNRKAGGTALGEWGRSWHKREDGVRPEGRGLGPPPGGRSRPATKGDATGGAGAIGGHGSMGMWESDPLPCPKAGTFG